MAITSYNQTRLRHTATIIVASDLSPPAGGTIYYHWFMDGVWAASTTLPWWSVSLPGDEQIRIEVVDTTDPDFDVAANAPEGFPARRWLSWIRSFDATTASYRVQQKLGAGDWVTLGTVRHDTLTWCYKFLTQRLDDLGAYTWQIVPIDTAGNTGTVLTIGPETIVRIPDAPRFTATFDEGTQRVAFAEAT